MTLTVGLDMDGVLCDWEGGFFEDMSEAYPHCPLVKPENRVGFHVLDQIPPEWIDRAKQVLERPGFYRRLLPHDGALDAMLEMDAAGLELIIVTSPALGNASCASDKFWWVDKQMGEPWTRRTVITRDKTLVRCDVLVDDKPHVKGIMKPQWTQVLKRVPANRHVTDHEFVLDDWGDWRNVLELWGNWG